MAKFALLRALKEKSPAEDSKDPLLLEMEKAITGKAQEPDPAVAEAPPDTNEPVWKRKEPTNGKTTIVRCLVIDQLEHWHDNALVDLKGLDTTAYTWGYYGVNLPVLVEQKDGSLLPFHLPDTVGESSNRLYKATHPEGFRATFRHRSNLLQKIQIGLMVALVLGLFGIMFILINQ